MTRPGLRCCYFSYFSSLPDLPGRSTPMRVSGAAPGYLNPGTREGPRTENTHAGVNPVHSDDDASVAGFGPVQTPGKRGVKGGLSGAEGGKCCRRSRAVPNQAGRWKVRWGVEGRGKRGGIRVIYYARTRQGQTWVLTLYPKNVAESIPAHVLRHAPAGRRLRCAHDPVAAQTSQSADDLTLPEGRDQRRPRAVGQGRRCMPR